MKQLKKHKRTIQKISSTSKHTPLDDEAIAELFLFLTDASEIESTILSNSSFYKNNKTGVSLNETPVNFVGPVFYL